MPLKGKYLYLLASHYLNATRIDVLHSPFVFSLYNHCIKRQVKNPYRNLPLILSRKLYIIDKLFGYFNFKTIMQIGSGMSDLGFPSTIDIDKIKQIVHLKGPNKITSDAIKQLDFIFINEELLPDVDAHDLSQLMHNNSMVYIDNINKDDRTRECWKQLCASDKFTVSIDFFFFGILSKRKEQVKEHFKLRLV